MARRHRWRRVGGLRAAQALKSAPVDVRLIDRRNYHLLQPLLYQVATGSLSAGEISAPLRSVLSRQKNTRVPLGEVVDLVPVSKRVVLAGGGRIKVNPDLTVPNYPDVYVIGDPALVAGLHGKPLPGIAQVAMQQGTYAAKAIVRKLQGETEIKPFKYFDKGDMAVIGRWAAVANIFGVHVSGFVAWILWAFIHLMYLVQFQSRTLVFTQWAIQDLTFNRGARLITGPAATDFDFNKEVAREESEDIAKAAGSH